MPRTISLRPRSFPAMDLVTGVRPGFNKFPAGALRQRSPAVHALHGIQNDPLCSDHSMSLDSGCLLGPLIVSLSIVGTLHLRDGNDLLGQFVAGYPAVQPGDQLF